LSSDSKKDEDNTLGLCRITSVSLRVSVLNSGVIAWFSSAQPVLFLGDTLPTSLGTTVARWIACRHPQNHVQRMQFTLSLYLNPTEARSAKRHQGLFVGIERSFLYDDSGSGCPNQPGKEGNSKVFGSRLAWQSEWSKNVFFTSSQTRMIGRNATQDAQKEEPPQ
jgi:hypothetical protein